MLLRIYDLLALISIHAVKKIMSFEFPPPSEEYNEGANLNSIPPPIFARNAVTAPYGYQPNQNSIPTTSVDPDTGEEVTRLINKNRFVGGAATSIAFADYPMGHDQVPQAAPEGCKPVGKSDVALFDRLQALIRQHPVWRRLALSNQLTGEQAKRLTKCAFPISFALCVLILGYSAKYLVSRASYTFSDGPFRELIVRFGYDPRIDPDARQYAFYYSASVTC